jgi:hypothetical protein
MISSFTVEFNYLGDHFKGFNLHPGVGISTTPLPCVAGRNLIVFENADNTPNILVEGVTSVNEYTDGVDGYLNIRPL